MIPRSQHVGNGDSSQRMIGSQLQPDTPSSTQTSPCGHSPSQVGNGLWSQGVGATVQTQLALPSGSVTQTSPGSQVPSILHGEGTFVVARTLVGLPAVKRVIVTFDWTGGTSMSKRKLNNMPQRRALEFGFVAHGVVCQLMPVAVTVEGQSMLS